MLLWFWAYDKVHYSRYLPVYLLSRDQLQTSHPNAYDLLVSGDLFTVQRSVDNPFGRVLVDQTIENTINRDTKTKGGLKPGAVFKWNMLRSDQGKFVQRCRYLAGQDNTDYKYTCKVSGKTCMSRD